MIGQTRYVSFASAGTRGIVYLGVLDALEDHMAYDSAEDLTYAEWRDSLRGAAGTSAGACVALMVLLGLDRSTRREVLQELADVRTVVRCPDVSLLLQRFGWEDGAAFREMVQRMLMRGGLSADSTLGDLKRLLRRELVCVCTDLQTGHAVQLRASTAPLVRVCDAVYASCCIPFVFTPAIIDGRVLSDGCMSQDMPLAFPEDETLFVQITPHVGDQPIASWADFLGGVVRCSVRNQEHVWDRLTAQHPGRCIAVRPIGDVSQMPSFDMHLDERARDGLLRAGYASALDWHLHGQLFRTVGRATVDVAIFTCDAEVQPARPPGYA